jgi:hypothetical protein
MLKSWWFPPICDNLVQWCQLYAHHANDSTLKSWWPSLHSSTSKPRNLNLSPMHASIPCSVLFSYHRSLFEIIPFPLSCSGWPLSYSKGLPGSWSSRLAPKQSEKRHKKFFTFFSLSQNIFYSPSMAAQMCCDVTRDTKERREPHKFSGECPHPWWVIPSSSSSSSPQLKIDLSPHTATTLPNGRWSIHGRVHRGFTSQEQPPI